MTYTRRWFGWLRWLRDWFYCSHPLTHMKAHDGELTLLCFVCGKRIATTEAP